ncbi:MAG: hypothetical protein AUJ57_02135 [Zetaproteobacteria bacterium CG1_02_53_45]|nr:MAG: hypothetical protein AUJ57_02135 [Zetaproteobacteria bacterium CG1_02_53_45]
MKPGQLLTEQPGRTGFFPCQIDKFGHQKGTCARRPTTNRFGDAYGTGCSQFAQPIGLGFEHRQPLCITEF